MTFLIVAASLLDLCLAVLLIAVSGFVLEGVNNTGPMMPEAAFFLAMVAWCIAAPAVAYLARARLSAGARLAIAASPLAVAVAFLALEEAFV